MKRFSTSREITDGSTTAVLLTGDNATPSALVGWLLSCSGGNASSPRIFLPAPVLPVDLAFEVRFRRLVILARRGFFFGSGDDSSRDNSSAVTCVFMPTP